MADIGVKMGVSGLAQFKQSMNQAQQSVKTLDAALKLNEKQLKATGDKEIYMQQKSALLQQQIAKQNSIIKTAQQALETMTKNGVDPASRAYQQMEQRLLEAQGALLDMHDSLGDVGDEAADAAEKTDKLTESLNGINTKVNFDAILTGIGKITDGMEAAGHKIEAIARDVWDTMATAAAWADNENTLAAMYGIDVETLQRMQGASRTIDTTVEAIIKSQQKLKNNMVYGSDDIMAAFDKLGVSIETVDGKTGFLGRIADFVARFNGEEAVRGYRDSTDVFWELGAALQNYGDEVERDAMAQKIFGQSWQQLRPLFQAGRREYEQTLAAQNIVTEENVNKLNVLDDSLQRLDQDFTALKMTVLSELAPSFVTLADGFSGLIGQFNEYIQTDEGQEKLEALNNAVTTLFAGISDVDFHSALGTASSILTEITGALGWIKDNQSGVVAAIQGIGGAFLALKAAEIVGGLVQSAAALKNLLGSSAAGAAGAAGSAGSAAAGAATAAGSQIPGLLKGLSLGALFKTAAEASTSLGTGLIGEWFGKNKKIAIVSENEPILPAPVLKHSRKVTGTATEDQMQTVAQDVAKTARQLAAEQYQASMEDLGKSIDASYEYNLNNPDVGVDKLFRDMVAGPLLKAMNSGNGLGDADFGNIFDQFKQKYFESFSDDWEGSTSGLLNILQEAMDEAGGSLTVETTPELIPDAVTHLQTSLDGEALHIPVIPDLASIDGTHANGLPFVPFDGYIAALHKGERVVPANQNKNVNFVNNNYFEGTRMYNNTDVQGLAAAIAERNRHNLQGVGG